MSDLTSIFKNKMEWFSGTYDVDNGWVFISWGLSSIFLVVVLLVFFANPTPEDMTDTDSFVVFCNNVINMFGYGSALLFIILGAVSSLIFHLLISIVFYKHSSFTKMEFAAVCRRGFFGGVASFIVLFLEVTFFIVVIFCSYVFKTSSPLNPLSDHAIDYITKKLDKQ